MRHRLLVCLLLSSFAVSCSSDPPELGVVRQALTEDEADYVTDDIPEQLHCNEQREVHIELVNTGDNPWEPGTHELGSSGGPDPLGGPNAVPLDETVGS